MEDWTECVGRAFAEEVGTSSSPSELTVIARGTVVFKGAGRVIKYASAIGPINLLNQNIASQPHQLLSKSQSSNPRAQTRAIFSKSSSSSETHSQVQCTRPTGIPLLHRPGSSVE